MNKLSTIKLGVFITMGVLILVIAIFLLGGKDSIFTGSFYVKAFFNDVQGLRTGSTVRLSGTDVGSVNNVDLTNDGRVRVVLSLSEDIRSYVTTSTIATIQTEGLVGNKVVVLQLGREAGEKIEEWGVLKAKDPVGFSEIVAETQGIMEYTKQMTRDLSEIVSRVNRGEGSIGKLLVDEELYNSATSLTLKAEKSLSSITSRMDDVAELFKSLGLGVDTVLNNVNSVVIQIDTVVGGIRKGKGILGAVLVEGSAYDSLFKSTIRDVQTTAEAARLAASRLAENMEALKHNWLFKSYFEERGYWDKTEYETEVDSKIQELNEKIKMLDERIETLRSIKTGNSE